MACAFGIEFSQHRVGPVRARGIAEELLDVVLGDVDFAALVGLLVGVGLALWVLGCCCRSLGGLRCGVLGLLLDRLIGVAVERCFGWR